MSLKKLPVWWGYLDDEGVIRVFPYKNDNVIAHVERMWYCKGIFDPFQAFDKQDAQQKIAKFLTEQQEKEKRLN